jgi:hypothetical protein
MNVYCRKMDTGMSDARRGTSLATVCLRRLRFERREIENAIRHLQRIQRLRQQRLDHFGTLELPPAVNVMKTGRQGKGHPIKHPATRRVQ